ncbi:MAG: DinB family protein [Acidobacteriota bacterium]|nr:DinB family protein [Acidobacteriota bacterium]
MKIDTKLSIASVCLACTSAVFAQTSPDPLIAGQKVVYGIVKNNIIKAAEKMPEENYAFKPTPEVRSFGQLVGHVADAQYGFCSAASGEKNPAPGIEKGKTSKADLVQGLKDGFAYCDKVYDGMTDAQAAQIVKFFGRDSAKLTVLSFNTAHDDEHYGNMVTYMRLKNIVPPSSESKPKN